MKLYKRMIRPMVALHGMNCKTYPLISDNYWVSEDFESILMVEWKEKIKDIMSTIEIEEKYVEIELPEPNPIKIEDDNLVCFMVDINKIDMSVACEYVKKYMEILPEEVAVAILPSIEPKVLSKDTVNAYINEYKRMVEEKYK